MKIVLMIFVMGVYFQAFIVEAMEMVAGDGSVTIRLHPNYRNSILLPDEPDALQGTFSNGWDKPELKKKWLNIPAVAWEEGDDRFKQNNSITIIYGDLAYQIDIVPDFQKIEHTFSIQDTALDEVRRQQSQEIKSADEEFIQFIKAKGILHNAKSITFEGVSLINDRYLKMNVKHAYQKGRFIFIHGMLELYAEYKNDSYILSREQSENLRMITHGFKMRKTQVFFPSFGRLFVKKLEGEDEDKPKIIESAVYYLIEE